VTCAAKRAARRNQRHASGMHHRNNDWGVCFKMLSKREHLTCGSILLYFIVFYCILLYVQKVKKVKALAVCRFAHSLTTKRIQSVCVLYLSCLACLFLKNTNAVKVNLHQALAGGHI
jgi:hypothetical protein